MKNIVIMKMSQNASPYADIPHVRKCLIANSKTMRTALQIADCQVIEGV